MSLSQNEIYCFDEFELHCLKRTLLRSGVPVSLPPKTVEVLTHLVANPGRVVTKEELIQAVWPESFVEESNLTHHIYSLRRAFADRSDYIVTVPGRGYQFTAEVECRSRPIGNPVVPEQAAPPDSALVGIQRSSERTHIVVEETIRRHSDSGTLRRRTIWAILGIAAVALVGAVGWRMVHPPTYGHAETVIADLDNETGDADFDHSLNRMLQIDLGQSPYFTIVGEGRARRTLKMMRQLVDERITSPLAREICQRLNGQVYVTPAIAKIGDGYLVSLEVNDCADGHSLGAAHREVSSKGKVLAAFGGLTGEVRRAAGESRASIRQFNKHLYDEPTASLEALKAYTEAIRLVDSGKLADAIALYRHVVELDPNFAVAYADMGSMYYNMGDKPRSREAMTKAYALRDTANERDRFVLEYGYHNMVTGDLHAQLDALRQWTATYPEDASPLGALVNLETWTGQYSAGAETADRLLARQRKYNIHGSVNYEIAARAYHHANMPDKLRAVYAEAVQAKSDDGALHAIMLQFAAENGDDAGVEREIAWSRGKPEESRVLQYAALAAFAAGQARRTEALFAEATVAAQRDKIEDTLADLDDYHARMLAELGLTVEARALIKGLPPADSSLDKAFAEAMVGDAAKALAEAQRQAADAPNDILMKVEYAPSVRAAVALRKGKPGEAIVLLQADAPYELRDSTVPYLRGQAYLAMHQAPQAAAEFSKLAGQPWLDEPPSPLAVLAHLGLARSMAQQNQFAESRKQYETLFALWKDADPDLPILLQARREFARLPLS